MAITKEKLAEFVADRVRYAQGSLDCNRSGINDPGNAKIKEAIDKGLKPYTTIDPKNRPGYGVDNETPTGLSFQDKSGVIHKAFGPGEKLFSGGEDFSVGKILRAKILGNYEGLNDFEQKSAGEGTGSLGGFLVNEAISSKILDLARNFCCTSLAGAWVLPMTASEMRIVKITGYPQSQWKAEHSAFTASDWAISPLNLKAMKIGCLVTASLELLEDAANSGSALEMAMGASLGLEIDRVALLGTGVSEPLGIDHAGINTISMGTNGLAPTAYTQLSQSLEQIALNNGIGTAFIMNPRSYFQFDRLLAATTNNRLEKPLSVQEIFDAGKMYHTNQCPITNTKGTSTNASTVYAGDFKQLVFGILKGLRFEISREAGTAFSQYEAQIRAVIRMDIGILQNKHFTKIEGLIP